MATISGFIPVNGSEGNDNIQLGSTPTEVFSSLGNDTVIIGSGQAAIILDGTNQGNDVIQGFKPSTVDPVTGEETVGDLLVVTDRNGDGKIDISDLQSAAPNANGDLVMTFPDGSSVTLEGVKSIDELSFVISGQTNITGKALNVGATKDASVAITTGKLVKGTDGADTIIGNNQDNVIDGGKGNDVFLINKLHQGHDTYVNLNLGDKMLVTDRNGDGLLNANDLAMSKPGDVNSALTHDATGTTIHFADGTSVTLEGVQVKTLDELHVHIDGEYGVFE
jgi:hypothetical protein